MTVSGLTDGTAYTFRVAATNAIGTGADAASNPVMPGRTLFDFGTPAIVDSGDPNSVELGVKFKADTFGVVTGVRFYKAAGNTGTHIGTLWAADGTKLATVTFAGETSSGWQQALFSTPVPVLAGATYVVSYLAPNGHYSYTSPGVHDRRGQRGAARAGQQRRPQRRLRLRLGRPVPQRQLEREQLLGRRDLRARGRRGPGHGRDRDGGHRLGDRQLERAQQRRPRDLLRRDALHRRRPRRRRPR